MGLATAVLFAVPAMAAVQLKTLAGNTATENTSPFSNGDGAIIQGSTTSPLGTAIDHRLNFSTTANLLANVTATPNTLKPQFDITGLSYQIFDAATNTAVSGLVAASNLLTFAATAGTSYYVKFTGAVGGSLGGNYTGNVAFTPIPGALLLLGPALAGLGFVGYRRSRA